MPSARCSNPASAASSLTRAASRLAGSVSRTVSGSPMTSATVLNGFGICVRSQLLAVQYRSASM